MLFIAIKCLLIMGYCLLSAVSGVLCVGLCLLLVRCCLCFADCCLLFARCVVGCLLFADVLFGMTYSLSVVCWSLVVVCRCVLRVFFGCVLCVVCYVLSCVVRCLWFAVCCVLPAI